MALGGGTWLTQNKVLPGAYINFVSLVRAQAEIADRGYGALALELDWGASDEVVYVSNEMFQKESQAIFGYDYGHDKMKNLRELFKNLKVLNFYRLNGGGAKATSTIGKAKYAGTRGNDIRVSVQADTDNQGKFVVTTYLVTEGVTKAIDKQTNLGTPSELVDNDFVEFIKTGTFTVNLAIAFNGGTNSQVTVGDYQKFIEHIEPYYFNCTGYSGSDDTIKRLFDAFVKRCREETGAKFQVVMHNMRSSNHEGVISVLNSVKDKGAEPGALVYWLLGKEAGCNINQSCTNAIYDGEYTVNSNYKQHELVKATREGQLVMHNVTDNADGMIIEEVRVLNDINTFTEFTKSKNVDFSLNQVIRVNDSWAYAISRLFNKYYLGKEQNDESGRIALWNDVVKLAEEYQRIRAITGFTDKDIEIPVQGLTKDSVIVNAKIQPTVAMQKLYMTTVVA